MPNYPARFLHHVFCWKNAENGHIILISQILKLTSFPSKVFLGRLPARNDRLKKIFITKGLFSVNLGKIYNKGHPSFTG